MKYVFWACLSLLAYTYLIYPLLLFLGYTAAQVRRDWRYLTQRRNRRRESLEDNSLPTVSLVTAVYNEESVLGKKLVNLRQIDYPPEKLELLFVSDGSTDRTNALLTAQVEKGIKLIALAKRRGKAEALNVGVASASHEILVFSDASTVFARGAVRQLARHFSDPTVGVVCGALSGEGTAESDQTEGVYWKYESMLRLMEARLGVTLTASGAIYAIRRKCYSPLAADTWIEDFVIPMRIRRSGYKVVYDPETTARDVAAASIGGEFTRRVRLAVGSFRALSELARMPLDPLVALAFFSHKLLRWLVPFLLIGLLVSNLTLWGNLFYQVLLAAQFTFYLWAGIGFLFRKRMQKVRYALLGYFLVAMSAAFLIGFLRYLLNRGEIAWQRVRT